MATISSPSPSKSTTLKTVFESPVALACPTTGLEFDTRTFALIDTDKDGRVRSPEIIAAIRASDDKSSAREALMAAPFEFSTEQAEHILDMQLSRLTRLGRSQLEEEMAKLRETIADLEAVAKKMGLKLELTGKEVTLITTDAT